ncbi:leucyl/phenylalanyl-tRNA--protein transferase [Gillisia sp. Q332]|uniref:leucyl/phenylalanyl-tRNA--protein transferase n=1 Tax=Gillisia xinjiangensis TaxID=3384765 RepID=UPI00391D38C5
MSVFKLYENFPPVEKANEDGLLAIGGDLSVKRLLDAYNRGIFPWYEASQPIMWWSPDPRMVLFPEKLKISKSMKQIVRQDSFRVSFNQDFEAVINKCAAVKRDGQNGTWITPEMKKAYLELFHLGIVKSVEVWQNEELVGGLYGIYLKEKKVFCGESMFATVSNASKFGFIKWVEQLKLEGVKLIDCQVYTAHLESLGAEEISRNDFLDFLS